MFQTVCGDIEHSTHFMLSVLFHFENRADYEITWKNTEETGRPHSTIWRLRIASWIPKATETYSVCVILIVFPVHQW
jgi:hypothetical protein